MYLITVLKQILDPEGFVHSKQENYWEGWSCPLLVDQGRDSHLGGTALVELDGALLNWVSSSKVSQPKSIAPHGSHQEFSHGDVT
jgi:hypothetical protein